MERKWNELLKNSIRDARSLAREFGFTEELPV